MTTLYPDAAGLHEGLKTLSDGGVPPKFLIIDDGWQCTDVDVPLRKPMTSRMMMLKEMEESMNATQDEFIDAELEILARSARNLPPSSSAGEGLLPFWNLRGPNATKQTNLGCKSALCLAVNDSSHAGYNAVQTQTDRALLAWLHDT